MVVVTQSLELLSQIVSGINSSLIVIQHPMNTANRLGIQGMFSIPNNLKYIPSYLWPQEDDVNS